MEATTGLFEVCLLQSMPVEYCQYEAGSVLSQGEWPQVLCPSAETSCIGSPGRYGQYSVAAHSLVAAATSGVRTTAVAFFPTSSDTHPGLGSGQFAFLNSGIIN